MKSILIFDAPTRCYDCPLYTSIDEGEYGFCDDRNILNQKEAQEKIRFNKKPGWCPLKSLPQKKNTDFHPNIVYANGWNDCLEEITK